MAELESLAARPPIPGKHEAENSNFSKLKTVSNRSETTDTPTADTAATPSKSMAEGLAKMMSDPKMRDMMKAQARMGIDMVYRDLFDLLNLSEPKRSEFEKLMREKATAGMDLGFEFMGTNKSKDAIKDASATIKAKMDDLNGQIKELIGAEDFSKVVRYESSTAERMQLKTLNDMLVSKNLPLDEGTESKLMDAMYEERQKFAFASDFIDQQNADMSRFTPENLARFGTDYEQLSHRIVTRAQGILSGPQLEVFRQSQEQMASMTKMHLEMAGKMFSSGQPAAP